MHFHSRMMDNFGGVLSTRMKRQQLLVLLGGFLYNLTTGVIYSSGNLNLYITSYMRYKGRLAGLGGQESDDDGGEKNFPRVKDMSLCYALAVIGIGSTVFFGGKLERRLGPRWSALIGGWWMSFCLILSSYTIEKNYWLFLLTFGIAFGVANGIAYPCPLACAYQWMPKRQGLAGGIVLAGTGLSPLLFGPLQTYFINPDNLAPTSLAGDNPAERYFEDEEMLKRVPLLLWYSGWICAGVQLIAISAFAAPPLALYDPEFAEGTSIDEASDDDIDDHCGAGSRDGGLGKRDDTMVNRNDHLQGKTEVHSFGSRLRGHSNAYQQHQQSGGSVRSPPPAENSYASRQHWRSESLDGDYDLSPSEAMKTPSFWQLWLIFFLFGQLVSCMAPFWKTLGLNRLDVKDKTLTYLGNLVVAVAAAVGRIGWGAIGDVLGFRVTLLALLTVSGIFSGTLVRICGLPSSEMLASVTGDEAKFTLGGEWRAVGYIVWLFVLYLCIGGSFSLFPAVTCETFGASDFGANYGVLYSARMVAALLQSLYLFFSRPGGPPAAAAALSRNGAVLWNYSGIENALRLGSGSCCVAALLGCFFHQPSRELVKRIKAESSRPGYYAGFSSYDKAAMGRSRLRQRTS